jgi:hypothetical protein
MSDEDNKAIGLALIIPVILIILITKLSSAYAQRGQQLTVPYMGQDGRQTHLTINLVKSAADRVMIRELFINRPRVAACITHADYIVQLMKERDAGTTVETHLHMAQKNYERTKADPQGAIKHSEYIDFQRAIRDLHRGNNSGFYWKDSEVFWGREVTWCLT